MALAFYYVRNLGSSEIRGRQIGTYLGARLNPVRTEPTDVGIFIKRSPKHLMAERAVIDACGRRYLDVVDAPTLLRVVRNWRGALGAIVTSRPAAVIARQVCPHAEVVLIPQHHANYARERRTRDEVSVIGSIGYEDGGPFLVPLIQALEARGWRYVRCCNPASREDVLGFYRTVDVQVMWRGTLTEPLRSFKNALRLANAGSFGIPTVAQPEPAIIDEFEGAYVPAESEAAVVAGAETLRDPARYADLSAEASVRAERYHIERIAPLYRALDVAA